MSDPHTISTLADDPAQRNHHTINDEGGIDDPAQPTVGVEVKTEKSHLTLVEGGDGLARNHLLPAAVQSYLAEVFAFQRAMRAFFDDALPLLALPTIVQTRVFSYQPADLLVGLRRDADATPAMRRHVDATLITIIIAESTDHALRCRVRNRWQTVARPDGKPFAVALTGTAAKHDFGLRPIEHAVLPCADRRVSIATRLAPDLGTGTREQAERRLARWRLAFN